MITKVLKPENKYKYKFHFIYCEFTLDFFDIDLNQLPSWVASYAAETYIKIKEIKGYIGLIMDTVYTSS